LQIFHTAGPSNAGSINCKHNYVAVMDDFN